MFLEAAASAVTMVLCLSNVFSTFKTLQQNAGEHAMRVELQFWSVYVLAIVLTGVLGWIRGDSTSLVQLVVSVVLVLCKHLDTEHAVISSVFGVAHQGMVFVDEHFVTPNSEKFLLKPCAQLVEFGLETVRESKSLSVTDRKFAAASILRSSDALRAEILKRDKERFSESLSGKADETEEAPQSPSTTSARRSGLQTPPRATRAPTLSFPVLRRYFLKIGIMKTDEEIGQVLKTFQGRDAELCRKLHEKFHHHVEDLNDKVSTPKSAGTIGYGGSSEDVGANAGPYTDNVVLRRRKTTGGRD